MKKLIFAVILLVLAGCGGGGGGSSPPPLFEAQIFSSLAVDGDIEFDGASFFITQGAQSVFAGIDPITGSEFRGFLDFPLTGAGGVPGNAIIDSASLEIFIDSISILPAAGSIPIRIELISFPPPTLLASDFSRTAQPSLIATIIAPPISRADIGRHVTVDVTPLMVEAQRRGLARFQIRILEDDGFVFPGLIEIDDTTDALAPLLTVTFF